MPGEFLIDHDAEDVALFAARAAYRLGLLDALLHEDVIGTLTPSPLITASLTGERSSRLVELEMVGVGSEDLADLTI